jgi:hypothetical protein
MSDAQRKAYAARAREIVPVLMCWAPTPSGGWCGGVVTWTLVDGQHRSRCSRCEATGLAASGQKSEIERLFGRSAAECQETGP